MNNQELTKLWNDYNKTKSQNTRNKLIEAYAPLVKVVAGKLSMYLNSMIEYDDMCSMGVFGLIDAIDKYDISMKNKFETYASLRIRGEILDQIRKMDWVPRTIRQRQKELNTVINRLHNSLGREPSDDEIMHELGLTEADYYKIVAQTNCSTLISIDDDTSSEDGPSVVDKLKQSTFDLPEDSLIKDELVNKLKNSLDILTEKERKVILLYYYEELTLKEIANILDVSEGRISQLHTKALSKLKSSMGDYVDIFYSQV